MGLRQKQIIERRNKQLEEMSKSLAAADKQIERLTAVLTKDRRDIHTQRAVIGEQQAEIERLEASLNNDMFDKMADEIDSLENEIERLQASLAYNIEALSKADAALERIANAYKHDSIAGDIAREALRHD